MESIPTSVGIQAKLGYLSEYITANHLSELIINHGHSDTFHHIRDLYTTKLNELQPYAPIAEMDRMHNAGVLLANNIFGDFHDKSTQFFIEHTGTSEMCNTKSDVRVYNDFHRIDASLKVYKSYNINILGTTFISIFKKLFHTESEQLPVHAEEYIEYFCSAYDNIKYHEFQSLLGHQYSVKTQMQNGYTKQIARKHFRENHNKIMWLFKDIFDHYYNIDRISTNRRLIKLLGLETTDSIYACIGKKNLKVFSSNSNQTFKETIKSVNELDFEVVIDVHLKGGFMYLMKNNKELLKVRISITDSGCSNNNPNGKFNAWLNFKQFM
jgi:hypothetical protein